MVKWSQKLRGMTDINEARVAMEGSTQAVDEYNSLLTEQEAQQSINCLGMTPSGFRKPSKD